MNEKRKKWYQIWWVWLIVLFVLGKMVGNSIKAIGSESSYSSSGACIGNQGCITSVRKNFQNTGKQILGEEYLGDGSFGISFLDARRGVVANAKVNTDCNCNVTNVDVSIMR